MDQFVKDTQRALTQIAAIRQLAGLDPSNITRIELAVECGKSKVAFDLPLEFPNGKIPIDAEELPELRKLLEGVKNLLSKQIVLLMATVREDADTLLPQELRWNPNLPSPTPTTGSS